MKSFIKWNQLHSFTIEIFLVLSFGFKKNGPEKLIQQAWLQTKPFFFESRSRVLTTSYFNIYYREIPLEQSWNDLHWQWQTHWSLQSQFAKDPVLKRARESEKTASKILTSRLCLQPSQKLVAIFTDERPTHGILVGFIIAKYFKNMLVHFNLHQSNLFFCLSTISMFLLKFKVMYVHKT